MIASRLLALFSLLPCMLSAAADASLLLISIDGLRHDYLTEADKPGLQIPHLRQLWRVGAHASSVRGVLPTAIYPSHTTIVTGTSPARHGIAANAPFDQTGQAKGFHWYAEELCSHASGGGLGFPARRFRRSAWRPR